MTNLSSSLLAPVCVCDRLLVSVACVDAISPINYALPTRTGTAAFLIIAFLKSTQNQVHVLWFFRLMLVMEDEKWRQTTDVTASDARPLTHDRVSWRDKWASSGRLSESRVRLSHQDSTKSGCHDIIKQRSLTARHAIRSLSFVIFIATAANRGKKIILCLFCTLRILCVRHPVQSSTCTFTTI